MDSSVLQRRRREFGRLANRGLRLEPLVMETARLLRRTVGFDGWCFLTMDPATLLPTHRFKDDVFGPGDSARLAENEFLEDDVNKFIDLARSPRRVGVLSEATGGAPHRSARYRNLLEPAGYGDELRVAFVYGEACWAALQLFRDSGHFSPREASFLASTSVTVADATKRALLVAEAEADQTADAPGLLLLDPRNQIEATNGASGRWLAELQEHDSIPPLPTVVYAVANRARAANRPISEETHSSARARVRARSGRWLALHASLLEEGPPGRVAVIIEPARPTDIAPLIAHAYGLSKGERRVAQLLMVGLSTDGIAQALFLSPYTVQDYLKGIFDKVGVRSRRELLAQLFFQHYVPRLTDDSLTSATGWFRE